MELAQKTKRAVCVNQMTPCNTGNSAFSESGTDTIASHAGFVNKNGQIKVIF